MLIFSMLYLNGGGRGAKCHITDVTTPANCLSQIGLPPKQNETIQDISDKNDMTTPGSALALRQTPANGFSDAMQESHRRGYDR